MILKLLRRKKHKPKFFFQSLQGRIRGSLGWSKEKDKNIVVVEIETCDEQWNWTVCGRFRYLDIKDVRLVLDDFDKVVQRMIRGE